MTVKTFFRQCRREIAEYRHMQERLDWLRSSLMPEAIRYKQVDVQTSGGGDRMAEVMPEILELERELQRRLHELITHQLQAYLMIGMIPDTKQRQVMMLYYLDNRILTWQQVAKEMGYTESAVYSIHKKALHDIITRNKRNP